MDIIIYAQAFGINSSGDVYYKDRYIGENRDEKIDLSQFFKDTCNKKQMVDFEIFDCLEEKNKW